MKHIKTTVFVFLCTLTLSLAAADKVYMANGIKIGEVTSTSAIIWTRLTATPEANWKGTPFKPKDSQVPEGKTLTEMEGSAMGAAGEVMVTYARTDVPKGDAEILATTWEAVNPKADFTHQFKLTGLAPGATYLVIARGRNGNTPPSCTIVGKFRTAPAADTLKKIRFTVVTGQDFPRRDDKENGHKIYPHMMALHPDFFVHTGDIEYYDKPGPLAKNQELARFKWNRIYALPYQRDFHNKVASYFIKDDHDTLKDDCWPGQSYGDLTWEQGQKIFLEQVPMGDKTYRTIRWGKDLQIWLVEGRDFRSPNTMKDGPEKTIWGNAQKEWFFETVKASDATFRILISPTPIVGPDRSNKNDNHANRGFSHEGNELREFISKQKNMVTICGDRHWQYVSVDPKTGLKEYSCGPTADIHAGGFSQKDKSTMHQYLNIKGGFLSVTVERKDGKPTIIFRHHGVDGQVYNEDKVVVE